MAVGGDGTVNEVVNGLIGTETAELAVIPRGTGGDFVRTFGIPSKLEDAVRIALGGKTRTIDAGHAAYDRWVGGRGEAYFANIASAGMSGAVAKRTNETTGSPLGGKAAYLWSTVAVFVRWQNTEISVTVDGETRSGPMFDVIVANCRYLAGGMKITPEAEPDDGLFDVLLIGDVTKLDLAMTMPKIYRGTHLPPAARRHCAGLGGRPRRALLRRRRGHLGIRRRVINPCPTVQEVRRHPVEDEADGNLRMKGMKTTGGAIIR